MGEVGKAMIVHVVAARSEQDIEVPEGSSSMDVLSALGLLPDAHVVLKGKTPIPVDSPLFEGDFIRIIKVASGG